MTIIRRPWTRQPQNVVPLSGPIGRRASAVFLFSGATQFSALPHRTQASINGTPSIVPYFGGLCYQGASSSYIDTGLTPSQLRINGAKPRTILIDYFHSGTSSEENMLGCGVSGDGQEFLIKKQSFENLFFGGWNADLSVQVTNGFDSYHVFACVRYDGTAISIRAISKPLSSGVSSIKSGSAAVTLNTPDTNNLHIGARTAFGGLTSSNYTGKIYRIAILPSVISNAEHDAWAVNPFQMLFGGRSVWLPSAATGIVTPTLTAASAVNIGTTYATPRVTFTRP